MATNTSTSKKLPIWGVLVIFLIFLLILISLPLYIYYNHFSENGVSDNTDDWSNFAGFFGDTLSPVLNIINILVVFYLALKVNAIEENRESNNIELENARRGNDFKYNAFKEISNLLFEVIKEITSMPSNQRVPIRPVLLLQLQYLLDGHSKLFNSLDNAVYNPLMVKLRRYESLDLAEKTRVLGDLNTLMQNVIKELGFE